jgi:hypothetical protein
MCLTLICVVIISGACRSNSTRITPTTPASTTSGPGGGTVIGTDSIVILKIQSIANASAGSGSWKLDVLIENTLSGNDLPNPVKDTLGKVVSVMTDQDMSSYKVNDVVNAKIKDVGDVDLPGAIVLYIYDVAKATP